MKTKAFIWVMVTLLGVAMTTAGSCDSSGSDSSNREGGDTTGTDTPSVVAETNPDEVDKSTIKAFKKYNDRLIQGINSYTEEEKDTIIAYAGYILNELPRYEEAIKKIGDQGDQTGSQSLSFLEEKLDDVSQKLEDQESKLTNKINMLVLALSVGSILLVVALVVTIVYFHNKLKKVSQSLATACPSGQENAGKETQTANGKVQKEMNDLRQHLDNVESQVKRVSAGIGNLEYRLNQSYPQPAPPTLQPAPLTPQPASPTLPMNNGICLYAELDAASNGGLLYKAQPTRTANSLYEITLTQPGATVGSFRVLEDCTILANVLRNRNSYLAACTFNGNDNATKIVNEAPGAVSKQQDGTWLVTKKAKIKLS